MKGKTEVYYLNHLSPKTCQNITKTKKFYLLCKRGLKMSNWQVTTYDENDNITETFLIENRTEKEAEREAMHSVEVRSSNDWTMKEIEDE